MTETSSNELAAWAVRWSQLELMPKYGREFRINKHATVVAATMEQAVAMVRAKAEREGAKEFAFHSTQRLSQRGGVVILSVEASVADLVAERDAFAKWIAMQLETGPDWACAQCVPRSYGNDMVVEGFVCIRHRAMAIVAAKEPTR